VATNRIDRRIARCSHRPNPLAPIRVCVRWIEAVDAERPPSAFDPIGQTGALVQTRERESPDKSGVHRRKLAGRRMQGARERRQVPFRAYATTKFGLSPASAAPGRVLSIGPPSCQGLVSAASRLGEFG